MYSRNFINLFIGTFLRFKNLKKLNKSSALNSNDHFYLILKNMSNLNKNKYYTIRNCLLYYSDSESSSIFQNILTLQMRNFCRKNMKQFYALFIKNNFVNYHKRSNLNHRILTITGILLTFKRSSISMSSSSQLKRNFKNTTLRLLIKSIKTCVYSTCV